MGWRPGDRAGKRPRDEVDLEALRAAWLAGRLALIVPPADHPGWARLFRDLKLEAEVRDDRAPAA